MADENENRKSGADGDGPATPGEENALGSVSGTTQSSGGDSAAQPQTAAAGGEAAQQGQNAPQIALLAQFVKDLSFENPNAPQIYQMLAEAQQQQKGPTPSIQVSVNGRQVAQEAFECELKFNVMMKLDETTIFAVELIYAGLFGIRNLDQRLLEPFLLVQAPHLLFPFARRILADAVRDGGFAPLLLDPIDFNALYQQELQRRAQQSQGEQGQTPGAIDLDIPPQGNA
ncbi:MAG: protein-export chaperone SecB [Alphaproteobacteria bacterium]|nr:MAG: protein-export chaperone SecB [Alphaproteobacteria bacterium]